MFAALQLLCIVVALSSLTMAGCIVVFRVQRARAQSVWCEPQQSQTTVLFIERKEGGTVKRAVFHCPLRPFGERCSEACLEPHGRCPLTEDQDPRNTRNVSADGRWPVS